MARGPKLAKKKQKSTNQPVSLITEEDYIQLKKENLLLENQRLQQELEDQKTKSKLLKLEEIHKRLLIKETRERIAEMKKPRNDLGWSVRYVNLKSLVFKYHQQ